MEIIMTLNKLDGSILIVDDSTDTLKFLAEVIEPSGANILIATTGEKALEVVNEIIPDVILLDAVMPGMGGFETCKVLKANLDLKHVPIIFMTGLSESEDIVRGLQAGGADYLVKPIKPKELMARIASHLQVSQLTKQAYQAMDVSQRFLTEISDDGSIVWSTPQAGKIINSVKTTENLDNFNLEVKLKKWIKKINEDQYTGLRQLKISEKENGKVSLSYIGKTDQSGHLIRVIEESFLKNAEKLSKAFGLTAREAEVLTWITNGKSNRDIGTILSLSPRTINKHLEHIHKKLGVENRTSAAAMAINVL
jgi:DNA-binding response OmpR family regulator/DNA-binding CsgD family transcriptional regulator